MKRYFAIMLSALTAMALCACSAGSAEDASLTAEYLPEGVEFIKTERDDGFTEHQYRDADGGRYTLSVDDAGAVRALEYDAKTDSTAVEVLLSAEEAFAVIQAARPEAQLITAIEDRDDGRYEWDILFRDGEDLCFYELDAATGAVLGYDIFFGAGGAADPAGALSAQLDGAAIVEISLEADDGRLTFEGEAVFGTGRVEFVIDAETGTVIELENESDD